MDCVLYDRRAKWRHGDDDAPEKMHDNTNSARTFLENKKFHSRKYIDIPDNEKVDPSEKPQKKTKQDKEKKEKKKEKKESGRDDEKRKEGEEDEETKEMEEKDLTQSSSEIIQEEEEKVI